MIDLYTFGTPNGRKASIMLEEVGLPYDVHVIDIGKGDQDTPAFRALSPNGKIPVILDREAGRTIFETGAILLYLARKTGKLEPNEETLQWLFFQAAHIGPMVGQLGHFKVHAKQQVPYAIERYDAEVRRLLGVLDGRLADRDHICGAYGLADIMTWSWVHATRELGIDLAAYPALAHWHEAVGARPAVQRGMAVPRPRDKA